MNCNNPILRSQADLLADAKLALGSNNIKDDALLAAVRQAVDSWGGRAQVCFCDEICLPECGLCEVDLPCCDINDVVKLEVMGCGCDACWSEVRNFEIDCGKLRLADRYLSGRLKITYMARNPSPSSTELRLARSLKADAVGTDTDLWLQGRVNNLPPAGYVKVCGEWIRYQCWAHEYPASEVVPAEVQFDPAVPVAVEVEHLYDANALLDASKPVAVTSVPAPSYLRDPNDPIRVEIAPPGVHTRLMNVSRNCNQVATGTYEAGTVVELGFAADSMQAFDVLSYAILANAYRSLMSACRGDKERQIAFDMMRWYSQELEKAWRVFVPARQPRMKPQIFPKPMGCGVTTICSGLRRVVTVR